MTGDKINKNIFIEINVNLQAELEHYFFHIVVLIWNFDEETQHNPWE